MNPTANLCRRVVTMTLGVVAMGWTWGAWAATYHVALGGTGDGSAANPWGTLQQAVGTSSPVQGGDSIVVKAGTYELSSAVRFQKSGAPGAPITLAAEPGTILNVTASVEDGALDFFKVHDWIIDGLRVNESGRYGIALHGCTNVTIQNCHVYRAQASAIIVNVANWGTNDVYPVPQNWNIKILGNTIDQANWNLGDNEAISLWATDGFEIAGNALADCGREGIDVKTGARNGSVHHNTVVGQINKWSGTGMGVYIDAWHYETYNIDVYQNVIYDSEEGFEINCEDCNKPGTDGSVHDIRIFNNVVYHNLDYQQTGWKGRGMSFYDCCDDGPHPVRAVHVFNNTFVGSQLLGIHIDNPAAEDIFIRNNIIVGHGSADVQIDQAASATVENNLLSKPVRNSIGAALTASNNVVADPLFVNAASNDYHLQASSPAIDKASGSAVPTIDFDGKPRPVGRAADLGAYEYGTATGTGGAIDGGATSGQGGAPGSGGATGRGGAGGRGGATGLGGARSSGGAIDAGATSASGGAIARGGATGGRGGTTGSGGVTGSGGSAAAGGMTARGDAGGRGGTGGRGETPDGAIGSGGIFADAAADGSTSTGKSSGCGCSTGGNGNQSALLALLLGLAAVIRRRRRRP